MRDLGATIFFSCFLIAATLLSPVLFGGLRPRFHTLGQAYEPGSRKYSATHIFWPLLFGMILLPLAAISLSLARSPGAEPAREVVGYLSFALAGTVGVLTVVNGVWAGWICLNHARRKIRRRNRVRV
ncbi:MAG: hypothetical protein ACFCU4_01430 [Puniceicoccaceae bacterium]